MRGGGDGIRLRHLAREGDSAYYRADDPDALADALRAIGTGVAISCSIELEHAPEDQEKVNLYFDEELLKAGGADGWRWDGPSTVEVLGDDSVRLCIGIREITW